ncbi:protein LNK1-like isoform X2 [Trifolium pratense]|uniref:Uncharacterized protein n=1 Tax=Trifolium pratense TaxID=57577 RepID=A0ACB0JW00_TRIPR|nr:protein LNK1-like isoform X2 [Trifolium pratense]CAJ2649040.1 unnamed protein product [Trifolium pratense]
MFEDNTWDEFDENHDLIVPHSGSQHNNLFVIEGDGCKKSHHDLRGLESSGYVSSYGTLGKDELYLQNMTQNERMPEKDSWSDTPEGVFSSCDGDSYREAKGLISDHTGMSDHCFKNGNIDSGGSKLCADDTILEEKCGVEDDGACQHPKNHISEADNELSFLDNDGWLDIGNLEDVDRMLSCDLTFGMRSLNNEEEFCWFSSSHSAEGSDDALMSDLKLHCADMSPLKNISEYNMDSSKDNIEVLPINDSNKKSSPGDKTRSQMDVDDNGVPASLSMFNESDKKSGDKDALVSKEKKKLPKSSAGKRKNGNSIHRYTPPEQYADIHQQFGASSSGVTSLDSNQKHKQNTDYDSLGCILTQIPLAHLDFSHAPNHTSVSSNFSGPRADHDVYMSPSLIESSYASNMDCSHSHSLMAAALKTNENREKYHSHGNLLNTSYKNERRANEMPFHSPSSSQQVAHQFENENEGHSKVRGVSLGFSSKIDSSTVQESSPISSALDQNLLKANSFCNLQQVLEQLDIKTKLCIRDSLYRLAKSAEQRDNNSNSNGCIGDGTAACKDTMTRDASRCTGLMDIETNTNPIDRSIAHLLFHRPSHPSTLLQNDIAPFKSSAMIHESTINPSVKAEKQVCQEDSSTDVEKKLLGDPYSGDL